MQTEFVHLHVHTDYSMLDGACRISDLAATAAEGGMPAVACTDHGNMCAAVEFYETMQEAGVKPIIGCEFYVAPSSRTYKDSNEPHHQGYHLVCLAEDYEGYQNLCRLNADAWLNGHYYKPRVDKELLAQHSKGIVALSACIAGEIPRSVLEHDEKKAVAALHDYLDIFGRDSFYLEIQNHGLEDEVTAFSRLAAYSREYGIPLVATNDSHYLSRDHAEAQEVLLCIGTQTNMQNPNRFSFPGKDFYFKTGEEMVALFPDHPEAIRNTLLVAERCNLALDFNTNHYPVYEVPVGTTREQYLRDLCLDAIPARFHFDGRANGLSPEQKAIMDRLDYELGIISKTGFTSYFLVVWDFLDHARRKGIPVGPGRGSGAGSIVAYLTRITDIDPIRYGLLFERFLNPDRVSPPDFDIDLCERRRTEVIEYVRQKYGEDSVAQIGTFGTLKAKAVIKDVGRAVGVPFDQVNDLTKLIPADPGMTLKKALSENPELRDLVEKEEWVTEIFRFSEVLEGLNRNMSIHAAGVIIGDQPLTNVVPLGRGSGNEVITQFSASPCEHLGLLKMDFLGLRTLTIIQDTLDLLRDGRGIHLDSSEIPMDDAKAFDLLNKGNTVAVFQLESSGMRDLCRRFGVHRIEDIIALIALYRPGPMQFLDDFINRKMGQTAIEYDVPAMKPILEETYGIMLYQEQVMQVVQQVASFSLGQADILRRAMGKKKVKVMEEQFEKFLAGCLKNKIDEDTARGIWDKIAKFAGYGFNKSHSAAYAFLSYRTAFLKANYPVEFMAAVLSSELGNAEKLAFFLKECREMHLDVRQPDVNRSGLRFSVDGDTIRFGLGAIKGVGASAAESIINARGKEPFKDLFDFCERVGTRLNRRVLEHLCRCGAFDSFGLARSQVDAMLDEAVAYSQQQARDRASGQGSLFDFGGLDANAALAPQPPDIPEWPEHELLSQEKELLGFYVTGHPLGEHEETLRTFQIDSIDALFDIEENTGTRIGGIINSISLKRSKKDNRAWAIIALEGLDASIDCMVFADAYEQFGPLLEAESPVFVEGTVSRRNGESTNVLVEKIIPIADVPLRYTSEVHIHLHQANTEPGSLARLRSICENNAGDTQLILCLVCASGEIAFVESKGLRVTNTPHLSQAVEDLFGEDTFKVKADHARPVSSRGGRNGRPNFRTARPEN